MSVKAYYLGILAEKAGTQEESIERTGLKSQVLHFITEKHPEFKGLSFVVSHNGSIMHHAESEVRDGDRITLIPPAPGG